MKKYTDYTVLHFTSDDIIDAQKGLSRSVKRYLEAGWVPQGGVNGAISKHEKTDFYTFSQAMVKIETE